MGRTNSVNHNLLLYNEKTFRDVVAQSYFMDRMTDGSGIIRVSDATEGSTEDFAMVQHINGDWQQGNETMHGKEYTMQDFTLTVTPEFYRIGVLIGPKVKYQSVWDVPAETRDKLVEAAGRFIDDLVFAALATPTPTKQFFAGAATSKATLTTSTLLTPGDLSLARAWAMTGGNESQPIFTPARINGKDYFVYLCHTDVGEYDLVENTTWTGAATNAMNRSDDHVLFKGANFITWNGTVVHSHPKVPIFTNGGSGADVPGQSGYFFGKGAISWRWVIHPTIKIREVDSDFQQLSIRFYGGAAKTKFNSLDYATAEIMTARTQIADA